MCIYTYVYYIVNSFDDDNYYDNDYDNRDEEVETNDNTEENDDSPVDEFSDKDGKLVIMPGV